jgi:hypothetical protein
MVRAMPQQHEALGPAERIIQTILTYTDHMVHNRPGLCTPGPGAVGVVWQPVTHKVEGEEKVVYAMRKVGAKTTRARLGVMNGDGIVLDGGRQVGTYREAGLFPEVAAWMYEQIAAVWKLDNEFCARWASYAYGQDHRDLKVVLAAFQLVQSRRGDFVREGGAVLFADADFRDVGEAMLLLGDMNPKMILRVRSVLMLPGIVAVNRALGFGVGRKAFLGRWPKAVTRWLQHREENPRMLDGLVKAGFRSAVMELAQCVGYAPSTPYFFQALRWKQRQARDGRRKRGIGEAVKVAETWEGLSEREICERVVLERPGYKRLVGMLPGGAVTRAVMAAAIEAGCLSDKDLVIATPTLEELGLLEVQDVKDRWIRALKAAEDMRAANIARNVRTKAVREGLEEAADSALKKAAEEVMRGLRVYVIVDVSGSMEGAIEAAKAHLARFVQGLPMDRLHVSVFNTAGREIKIPHASAAGVENAFKGVSAGGGTDYGAGIRVLTGYRPKDGEDVLFIFVGDEGNNGPFHQAVEASGLKPVAFGLVPIVSPRYGRNTQVRDTAMRLGIPCFEIAEATFADPYAIPRVLRALIAATPVTARVGVAQRETLVDVILKTKLLARPAWSLPEPSKKAAVEVLL